MLYVFKHLWRRSLIQLMFTFFWEATFGGCNGYCEGKDRSTEVVLLWHNKTSYREDVVCNGGSTSVSQTSDRTVFNQKWQHNDWCFIGVTTTLSVFLGLKSFSSILRTQLQWLCVGLWAQQYCAWTLKSVNSKNPCFKTKPPNDLADRPDKAWIQTFYKSASWCCYFGILLIRLLQLNHIKICLFWDHVAVISQINSADVTCYMQWIFIDFETQIMKLPLTGDRWRGEYSTINTNDPAVKLAVVQTVVLCASTSCVHSVCFPLTEPGLCMNTAHTERTAGRPWGDIFWIWQNVYWIRIADYTF